MLTIAWDIDDVLNCLTREWLKSFSRQAGSPVLYEDLLQNPPHKILGITKQDYLASLDKYRSRFYQELAPRQEILNWFETHGMIYRHIALTAVPYKYASISARWCMFHFGKWIRSYNFIPSFRQEDDIPQYDNSKMEYIQRAGNIDIFIDDSRANMRSPATAGLNCILFPAPWNSNRSESVQTCLNQIAAISQSKTNME